MSNTLNIEEIKDKMITKLEPSGWARVLKSFIYSKDFENIILGLLGQVKDGKRFTPTMKNWFRAFEECPYDKLKIVMLGQDPYPGLNQADGIAFSLSQTPEMQPSLKYMLDAVRKKFTLMDIEEIQILKDGLIKVYYFLTQLLLLI